MDIFGIRFYNGKVYNLYSLKRISIINNDFLRMFKKKNGK